MHFMLQKEVAERLAAAPGSKQYGRLSVMAQYFCEIELLLFVPSYAFFPAPQVQSSFIRLQPVSQAISAIKIGCLEEVVKCAFAKRRKTLSNALKGLITQEELKQLGIDPGLRAEAYL